MIEISVTNLGRGMQQLNGVFTQRLKRVHSHMQARFSVSLQGFSGREWAPLVRVGPPCGAQSRTGQIIRVGG